jgi:hypothetical protein
MFYEQLLDFVQNRMKMSHVYQPVMLMTLLRGRAELNACHRLLEQVKEAIEQADTSVEGFNFGINDGAAAGQKVFHRHVHLVPRRNGDVDDPTGGVRNVIPGKGVARHRSGGQALRQPAKGCCEEAAIYGSPHDQTNRTADWEVTPE